MAVCRWLLLRRWQSYSIRIPEIAPAASQTVNRSGTTSLTGPARACLIAFAEDARPGQVVVMCADSRHHQQSKRLRVDRVSDGRPTSVDVQDLARDERGLFQIQDPVDDVAYLARPAKWGEGRPCPRRTWHRDPDDSGGERVDSHAA